MLARAVRRIPRQQSILRTLTSAVKATCPSCGTPLPTALPTCPKCLHIAPLPSSTTYHSLFQLPQSPNPFVVDVKELKRRFLEAQRLCHPDAWSGKGEKEQGIAAAQSSEINKAYQTLLSPRKRAQYIIAQQGIPTSEEDTLEDSELIMEVMEARERLEEATKEDDVETVRVENRARIIETMKAIEEAIGQKDWPRAKMETIKLRYWEGIENAAREVKG